MSCSLILPSQGCGSKNSQFRGYSFDALEYRLKERPSWKGPESGSGSITVTELRSRDGQCAKRGHTAKTVASGGQALDLELLPDLASLRCCKGFCEANIGLSKAVERQEG